MRPVVDEIAVPVAEPRGGGLVLERGAHSESFREPRGWPKREHRALVTSPQSSEHGGSAAKRCPRPTRRRGHRAARQLAVRVRP
jgi:hypothetical protein